MIKKFRDAVKNISLEKYYEEFANYERDMPKFGLKSHITRFAFKVPEEKDRPNAEELFKNVLKKLIDDAHSDSKQREGWKIEKFSVQLYCDVFKDPVIIPARDKEQNTPDEIFNAFMKLEQSYKEANILHQEISAWVTTFSVPEGQGGKCNLAKYTQVDPEQLIKVENNSNLCLFIALELSRLFQVKKPKDKSKKYHEIDNIPYAISHEVWKNIEKKIKIVNMNMVRPSLMS